MCFYTLQLSPSTHCRFFLSFHITTVPHNRSFCGLLDALLPYVSKTFSIKLHNKFLTPCFVDILFRYVIVPFCASCCPSEKLVNFITWLGYINSALNPIIYTVFNLDFRRAFKKLLGIKA